MTLPSQSNSIIITMKTKEQVIFDINSKKFKYMYRDENKIKNRVSIDVLNQRLNKVRKSNIYSNAKMIAFSIFAIAFFALISSKF